MRRICPDHTRSEISIHLKKFQNTVQPMTAGYHFSMRFMILHSWSNQILNLMPANLWFKKLAMTSHTGLMKTPMNQKWQFVQRQTSIGTTAHKADTFTFHQCSLTAIGIQKHLRPHGGRTKVSASDIWLRKHVKLEFSTNWQKLMMLLSAAKKKLWTKFSIDIWNSTSMLHHTHGRDSADHWIWIWLWSKTIFQTKAKTLSTSIWMKTHTFRAFIFIIMMIWRLHEFFWKKTLKKLKIKFFII